MYKSYLTSGFSPPLDAAPEEKSRIFQVFRKLAALEGHVESFSSAISLIERVNAESSEINRRREARIGLEYKDQRTDEPGWNGGRAFRATMKDLKLRSDWAIFAARAAVTDIYEFRCHLKSLESWISDFGFDNAFVRDAGKRFEATFPDWKSARHAALHSAGIQRYPEKESYTGAFDNGAIKKDGGGSLLISGAIFGETFTATRKGHMIKVDLNRKSEALLQEFLVEVVAGAVAVTGAIEDQ